MKTQKETKIALSLENIGEEENKQEQKKEKLMTVNVSESSKDLIKQIQYSLLKYGEETIFISQEKVLLMGLNKIKDEIEKKHGSLVAISKK